MNENRDIPGWVGFPDKDWDTVTPIEAGLEPQKFNRFRTRCDVKGASFGGEDHSGNKWGTVLTRGGYLVHAWGDRHYRFQTASVGKAFVWALVGFAVEDGMIDPDEPIHKTWIGENQLSHSHKHLNQGHHAKLTWRSLLSHAGGFPVELGSEWRKGRMGSATSETANQAIPPWAKWTGDPSFDCYSHLEPDTVEHYSSAGYWRLGQALTVLWQRDLKEVLDERLFSKIGIPAARWDWLAGLTVQQSKLFYPAIPDSYTYLDPPYEIDGHIVRSGPGWVVISASDLARFGHLIATQGVWKGKRLLTAEWVRGHGGGNGCGVCGEHRYYTAVGKVTTEGIDLRYSNETASILPDDCFIGPVIRRS